MPGLKEKYRMEIRDSLRETLALANPMQVPRLVKVVVNMGFDSGVDKDVMKSLSGDLARLTGQAAVTAKARKSISNFKLRECPSAPR